MCVCVCVCARARVCKNLRANRIDRKMVDYESFTCADLRKQLKKRQADTTGRKAELIDRLQKMDDAKARPRKRKAEEMMGAVQSMIQCPICLNRMGGHIHQVKY